MSARSTPPSGPGAPGIEPAFRESFTAFCKAKGEEPKMGMDVGGTHIKAETLYQVVSQQRPVNNRKATVFWEGIATTLLGPNKPSSRSFGQQLEFFYKRHLIDYAKHMASLRAAGQPSNDGAVPSNEGARASTDGAMPSSATVVEASVEQVSSPEPQGAPDGGTVAPETVRVAEGINLPDDNGAKGPDDNGAKGPPPRRSERTTKGRRLARPGSAKRGGDGTRARSQGRASAASSESDSDGESGDTQAGEPRAHQHSPGLALQRGWPRLRIRMDDPRYKWRNLTELHRGTLPATEAGSGHRKRERSRAAPSSRSAANSPVRKLAPTSPGQPRTTSNLSRKPMATSPALKGTAGNQGVKSRPSSPGPKSRKSSPARKPRQNTPAPFSVAADAGVQEGVERPAKARKVEKTPPLLPTAGLEPKAPAPGRRSRPASRASSRPSSRGVSPVEGLVTAAPVVERGPTPPIRSQLHKSKSAADVPQSAAESPLTASPVRRSGRVSLSPVRLRIDVSPSKLPAARKNGAVADYDVPQATQQGPAFSPQIPQSGTGDARFDPDMPDAGATRAAEKPVAVPRPVPSAKPPLAGGRAGGDATEAGDASLAGVMPAASVVSAGPAHGGGLPAPDPATGSARLWESSGQAAARLGAGPPAGLPALPPLQQSHGGQAGVSPSPPRPARGRPRPTPPLAGPSPTQAEAPQRPPPPALFDPFPVDTFASIVARVKEIGTTGGDLEPPPPADTLKRLRNMGKRRRDLQRPRDASVDVKADEERIRRSSRARTTVSLFTPSHKDERLKAAGHRRLRMQELAPGPAHVAGPAADGAGEEGSASGDEEFEPEETREGGEYQAELPEYRDRPAEPTVEERAWCNGAGWVLKAGGLGRGPDQLAPIIALRANKDPPTHFRVANGQVLSDNIVRELGLDRMGASCRKGWTVNEERAFEDGLSKHYKQFGEVQRNLLPTKSHKDIVEYYYNVWKTQATARAKAYEKSRRRKKAALREKEARALRDGRPVGDAEEGAEEDEADLDPSPSSGSDGDDFTEEAARDEKRRLATEAQARRRRKRREEEQLAKAAAAGAAGVPGAMNWPASVGRGGPAGVPGGRGGRGEFRPAIFPASGSLNRPEAYMPGPVETGYMRGNSWSGPVGGRGGPSGARGPTPSHVPGMNSSAPYPAGVAPGANMGRGGPQGPQSNYPNTHSFTSMGPMGTIPQGSRGYAYPAYSTHMAHMAHQPGSMALLGLPYVSPSRPPNTSHAPQAYASLSRPPSTSHAPQASPSWVPQGQGYYTLRPQAVGPPGPPGMHPSQYVSHAPAPQGPPGQYPPQYASRPPAPQHAQPPGSAPPPVMTYPPPGYQPRGPPASGFYPRPTTLLSTVPMLGGALPRAPGQMPPQQQGQMPPQQQGQMLPQQQSRVPKLPIAAPKRGVPKLPIARPTAPAEASNPIPRPTGPADASNPHYAASQGNGGPFPNPHGAPPMAQHVSVPSSTPLYVAAGSGTGQVALDQSAALRAKAAQTIQQHVQTMPAPSASAAPQGLPLSGPPHSSGGQPFQDTLSGPAVGSYTYGGAPWQGVDPSAVLRAKAAQTIQQHVQTMPAPSAAMSPPGPPPSGLTPGTGGPPFQNVLLGPAVGGYASGGGRGVASGQGPGPPGGGVLGGVIFPDVTRDRA